MEFSGTFELDDVTTDVVWLALSDPHLIWDTLPGCQFIARVEDDDPDFEALREEYDGREPELTLDPDVIDERAFEEGATYAALLEVSLGSVSPTFRAVGTVDERAEPRMVASGEGSSGDSSFEGRAEMELTETGEGVAVDWQAEADVFGRIAQMGQRVVSPAANRIVKRFFGSLQETVAELSAAAETDAGASGDEEGATGGATAGASGDEEGATGGATAGASGDGDAGTDGDEDAGTTGVSGGATASGGRTGEGEPTDEGDRRAGATAADREGDRDADGGLWARLKRLLGLGQ
jgi:carbon monoxide dehydrogenase subunit G